MTKGKRLAEALRHCRQSDCYKCPMMEDTCDYPRVEMVDVPVELLKAAEEELRKKVGEV